LKVYIKSLLVGLCAAAVVIGVGWSAGLVTHLTYKPPPSSHPSLALGHDFVNTTWELVEIDVTMVRWYVAAIAGLALVTASGWQLRRGRRLRR
jgi:hypothetical protein